MHVGRMPALECFFCCRRRSYLESRTSAEDSAEYNKRSNAWPRASEFSCHFGPCHVTFPGRMWTNTYGLRMKHCGETEENSIQVQISERLRFLELLTGLVLRNHLQEDGCLKGSGFTKAQPAQVMSHQSCSTGLPAWLAGSLGSIVSSPQELLVLTQL